jgi:hypothetical protein
LLYVYILRVIYLWYYLIGRLGDELVVQHVPLVHPLLHLENLQPHARPQLGQFHGALLRAGVACSLEGFIGVYLEGYIVNYVYIWRILL